MHDPHTNTHTNTSVDIDLQRVRLYDGDELIFDGADPSSYVVLQTPEQLADFCEHIADGPLDWPEDPSERRDGQP
jgi:hypothetical protein